LTKKTGTKNNKQKFAFEKIDSMAQNRLDKAEALLHSLATP